jgi:hypothetical protein
MILKRMVVITFSLPPIPPKPWIKKKVSKTSCKYICLKNQQIC